MVAQRGCCRSAERGATAAIRGRFQEVVAGSGEVFGQSVGRGANVDEARERAYGLLSRVDYADGFHRTDIGIPH